MKINSFFILLLLGVFISCDKDYSEPENPVGDDNWCADHVLKEPYLVYDGDQTGFAVMIQTTDYIKNLGSVQIQYGTDGYYGDYHNMAFHHFERDGGEDYSIWRYRWQAGNLTINKKISYRVRVDLPWPSDANFYEGWFYTSAESHDDFSFYAFGDTRDGDDNYASCMGAIAYDMDHQGYYKGYRLLLHMGDFVYNGAERFYFPWGQAWNKGFFGRNCNNNGGVRTKAQFILRHVPVMGTLGNHDFAYDGHTDKTTSRYYVSNWPYKMYNNSTGLSLGDACKVGADDHISECYYSFDYGIVHFISLNTYTGLYTTDSKQYKWLENDLISNNKPWTVVFFHEPMYNGKGKNHPCNQPLADGFSPLFKKYGVDIVLQGHQHVYTRVTIDKGTEDEIPYLILGRGGTDNAEHYDHWAADAYSEVVHFARFDVTSNIDSMHVLVTEKHFNNSGDVDDFYFKNRPKK